MSIQNIGAKATVTLTVEVSVTDSWGPDCPISQIHQQAITSAVGKVTGLLKEGYGSPVWVRLIGQPTVTSIITQTRKV